MQLVVPGQTACLRCSLPDWSANAPPRAPVARLPSTDLLVAGMLVQSALKFLLEFGEVTQHLRIRMTAGESSFVSSSFRSPNDECSSELCRERQGELQALGAE